MALIARLPAVPSRTLALLLLLAVLSMAIVLVPQLATLYAQNLATLLLARTMLREGNSFVSNFLRTAPHCG